LSSKVAPITLLVAGGIVVGNAWAAREFCVLHPLSADCYNTLFPGPAFPGKGPAPPAMPMGSIVQALTTGSSTVASVNAIMR